MDDISGNKDGWECVDGIWTYAPYAQFARASGFSFHVWVSPRHIGIYLRNLEACYAAFRAAGNSQLSQADEQTKRLLTPKGISGRELHRQVPSFDAQVLLRLIAGRWAFVALKTADLDDYENVTIYSAPEGAEREDLFQSGSFAEHVGGLTITDPFLTASKADRIAAERRIETLADIEAGRRQDTPWMRSLRRRVIEGERNGIPAVVTCLTNYVRSGNRKPRATLVQKEIGKDIVQSEWNSGKAARPIDLFRRYRQQCVARGVDALSRTAFDQLRKQGATPRRALNTGGIRAYQAQRSATDPVARSLSAMGFGHTVHIDSSKFDNRVAPSILLGLPAECATFYLAVDEATGMPVGCKLIFGAARIQGMALLMRDIVRRHGFLPRMIHCDRGPENRSKWMETFCHLRTGIRYSPTAGSAWNGLAENTIKQVNDQVAHRLAGSTLPDRRGRAVDGRFKSYRNARTDFLTIVEEVEHFVFHVLSKVPDRINLTPEEKRDHAVDRYGCMGVPTEYTDDFLIQTSTMVKLGKRLDSRRGLRTDLGYYVSDELIDVMSRATVEEARRDCNYPEVMYVRTDAGNWIKAFHSSIAQCVGKSDDERLFELMYVELSKRTRREAKVTLGEKHHQRIEQAKRARTDSAPPPSVTSQVAAAGKVHEARETETSAHLPKMADIDFVRSLTPYIIEAE